MQTDSKWTQEEREAGFRREQALMRAIHDSPVKLTQSIQEETSLILACQVNALREALTSNLGLLVCFIGPYDELGQAHIKMSRDVLGRCK